MKTKDFIELLERNGWKFKRHGSNHDIYTKGGERESVPRHREIDEDLAKAIIKRRAEISPLPNAYNYICYANFKEVTV